MNHQQFIALHGETDDSEFQCKCCGRELNPRTMVWFEKATNGDLAAKPGLIAADQSQGWFTYGAACSRKVLVKKGVAA
jgi:hypothetical protein